MLWVDAAPSGVTERHVAAAARLLEQGADIRVRAHDGATVANRAGNDRDMDSLLQRYGAST
jgi:hypothetical protein